MAAKRSASTKDSIANLGFEAKLWLAANMLRNNMDAAEIIVGQEQRAWGACFGRAKRACRVNAGAFINSSSRAKAHANNL